MNALEAFKRALFKVSSLSSHLFANRPGAVIERMSDKEREALKDLKSSDIGCDPTSERIDGLKYLVETDEHYRNKEFEKDKLDFDKKILK